MTKIFSTTKRLALMLSLAGFLLGAGCSSTESRSDGRGEMTFTDEGVPAGDYTSVLERWTDSQSNYSGISEACEATATLLSTDLLQHQIYGEAKLYSWSGEQYKDARQKALDTAQTSTKVFIKLYTAKDENNNIDSSSTNWNIFLQVGGKRVSPDLVKKVFEDKVQLANKFPYITVWSKNYYATFPISTTEAQAEKAELIIAGPLGSMRLKFPH